MSLLARLLNPKAIVGMVCGAIALGLLLSVSDIRQVGEAFQHFPPILVPVLLALVAAREAVRIVEWHYLLTALGERPLKRHSVLTLLGGDASQILPAGVYFQNYLLEQTQGTAFATSLAATLAMQLMEAAVALVVLAAVGVPGWPWLRPVVAVVLAGYIGFLLLISRPSVAAWLEARGRSHRFGAWISDQLAHFLEALECLLNWRVILRTALLTSSYLVFTIGAFYVTTRAYGLERVGLPQAAAIYCFVLTLIILVPLPSDLGLSEGGGVTVLLAYGVSLAEGLTIMLIIRFSVLLFTELLAGGAILVLHDELRHLTGQLHDVPELPAGVSGEAGPHQAQHGQSSEQDGVLDVHAERVVGYEGMAHARHEVKDH
ncbi:MAG TPA: lysylphosphatidylglycerol synthase transmembrane domain-containing protein [Chloroflexota bacterium]|nr:lysylphosphatidylglycerol synthase transmembrane domain-containing protein [Chloroflexota bacterium]